MSQQKNQTYVAKGVDRIVFFSDAVFAIAITLLALEIKIPDSSDLNSNSSLTHILSNIFPQILAFMLSFLIIGVFWASHVRKYRALTSYNQTFVMLNLALLMLIAFMPFPTSLISGSPTLASVVLYTSTLVMVGITSALNWAYAVGNRFIENNYAKLNYSRELRGPIIMSLVFLTSIAIAFIDPTYAMWSWLLLIPTMGYFR